MLAYELFRNNLVKLAFKSSFSLCGALKGLFWHFWKSAVLLSGEKLDEKIDTTSFTDRHEIVISLLIEFSPRKQISVFPKVLTYSFQK